MFWKYSVCDFPITYAAAGSTRLGAIADTSAALGAAVVVRVDKNGSGLHVDFWSVGFVLWCTMRVGIRNVVD